MIDAKNWMNILTGKLRASFKDRLLFVGLQGSYHRGEAHAGSDIDAVVILDSVAMHDLLLYRNILSQMPENGLACGFISGRQELMNWPRHELFQFARDTEPVYGGLQPLLPEIRRQDIIESVKIGAAALYHSCCHAAVHGVYHLHSLKGLYKSAFFLLQALYYLRSGIYISTKRELLPLLPENERQILCIGMDWDAQEQKAASPDAYFSQLLDWCASVLNQSLS